MKRLAGPRPRRREGSEKEDDPGEVAASVLGGSEEVQKFSIIHMLAFMLEP